MNHKLASYLCFTLWIALLLEAFVLAPPPKAGTYELIQGMLLLQASIDPSIFALFQIIGILPLLAAAYLFQEGPLAWTALMLSFFLGAFALLPYLCFRKWFGAKKPIGWILGSQWLGLVPGTALCAFTLYGLNEGSPHLFWEAWRNDGFVQIMSFDAIIFVLALQLLTYEDAKARSGHGLLWGTLPLFGPILWIAHRSKFQ